MNVLVIPAWYPRVDLPVHGVFVREQARAAALHHDVAVLADDGAVASGRLGFALREQVVDGIRELRATYRASRVPAVVAGEYIGAVLAAIGSLARQGRKPDMLHAHVYHAGVAALIAGRRHRLPVVVSEHSSHFLTGTLPRSAQLRARVVFGRADLVCPVSEHLRAGIEAHRIRARFRVVPNVVDTDVFTPADGTPRRDDAGRARVLVVSGLHPVKGVATLLRAAARVAEQRDDFRVDVIGDGPERATCEAVIAELGLADRVALHGYRPQAEVAEWLRRASFLVLPSRTETFGIAAVEALAAGRPVLAARVGAVPELIGEDVGVLVDAPTVAALAGGLSAMLDRFESFPPHRLAAVARRRCGLAAVGARWDEVYRDVVEARRA